MTNPLEGDKRYGPAGALEEMCYAMKAPKYGLPRTVVSFGPTQSRIGPTKTGPKLRAKMPIVHNTANLLS